jgi:hypothetical protein
MSIDLIPKISGETKATASLFQAGLTCLTKCFLLSPDERGSESVGYAAERADANNFMQGEWRLATNVTAQAHNMESTIPMVERVTSGEGKTAQHVPVRFVYTDKLSRDDKLPVTFDALVLSGMMGGTNDLGRIVHGAN